jgi:GNAT superfamily N-acetyltransferase
VTALISPAPHGSIPRSTQHGGASSSAQHAGASSSAQLAGVSPSVHIGSSTHDVSPADDVVELVDRNGSRMWCSLWWRTTPSHRGRRTGFIGALACEETGTAAGDDDMVAALLTLACERLREAGCQLAVGPVDGDTWHRYRLVTWSDGTPPFALEPWSVPDAIVPWERAGFTPLETYASLRDDALAERDPRAVALVERFRAAGVTLRDLDLARFDEELTAIHALALRGFRGAPLFTPIGFDAFAALYRPLAPRLDRRLCPVAVHDGRIVGVLFALRDPNAPETVVLKTIVRGTDRRFAGLGAVLTDRARAAAHALGATRAISALQHDGDVARSLCPRAVVFRRYAVFAKELS